MALEDIHVRWSALIALLFLAACTTSPPSNPANACVIFDEKGGWFNNWYRHASRVEKEFNIPKSVMLATIWQESRFQARARPPRTRLLWVIPWRRPSSAYGFAQAQDGTWAWYQRETGRMNAKRRRFRDAIHFVGWYHDHSARTIGLPRDDAYSLYLAYHEGHGGFRRRTFEQKPWLMDVARRVQRRANEYERQLARCR